MSAEPLLYVKDFHLGFTEHDLVITRYQRPVGWGEHRREARFEEVSRIDRGQANLLTATIGRAVRKGNHPLAAIKEAKRTHEPISITQDSGILLTLLVLAARDRTPQSIVDLASQLEDLSIEETYYWFAKYERHGSRAIDALRALFGAEAR
ncbi:hypothetical protein V6N00_13585 [Tersicoccus sp. MR15.9]|uniref:DUF7680 family protein n=1 Tax=Tersicoccus mangrovi TaxID=3121635 RepID=UPI002FE59EC3